MYICYDYYACMYMYICYDHYACMYMYLHVQWKLVIELHAALQYISLHAKVMRNTILLLIFQWDPFSCLFQSHQYRDFISHLPEALAHRVLMYVPSKDILRHCCRVRLRAKLRILFMHLNVLDYMYIVETFYMVLYNLCFQICKSYQCCSRNGWDFFCLFFCELNLIATDLVLLV